MFQALFRARLTSLCELRRTCDIVAVAIASVCKSFSHCAFFLLSASNSKLAMLLKRGPELDSWHSDGDSERRCCVGPVVFQAPSGLNCQCICLTRRFVFQRAANQSTIAFLCRSPFLLKGSGRVLFHSNLGLPVVHAQNCTGLMKRPNVNTGISIKLCTCVFSVVSLQPGLPSPSSTKLLSTDETSVC